MDLQEISDRLEIDDLITRYTRAIDTGDWDRARRGVHPGRRDRLHLERRIAAAYSPR